MAIAFPSGPVDQEDFTDPTSNKTWVYNATQKTWESKNYAIYDIAGGVPGTPVAGEIVAQFDIARAVLFPLNFQGSYWNCSIAPVNQAIFTIAINGTQIGSIIFAAGASTATFTSVSSGTTVVAAGSILTINAPNPADANISSATGTLAGILQ